MLVVDASALAELLLGRRAAGRVAEPLEEHGFELHAPHLIDLEVLSALRHVVASGDASPGRGDQAVADFLDLPIERYPHDVLVPRVWQLRDNFFAYDAAYIALAESLTAEAVPLLTADARLARAAREHLKIAVLLVDA
jgi:predicted nucleic acid-binding protein